MSHLPGACVQLLRAYRRRLDVRIVALFLGLLLTVQLVSFATIRHSIDRNASMQVDSELRNGSQVLRHLLAQNAQRLTDGARLLAADYGFRTAVTSADVGTIRDALGNQATRIGADAVAFSDPAQRLVASNLPDSAALLALVRANLQHGKAACGDTTVCVLSGLPYQLVTVPVRAPSLIGHVSMGFALSSELVSDLESLSALRLALVVRQRPQGNWTLLPVGAKVAALGELARQLAAASPQAAPQQARLAGETFSLRTMLLAGDAQHEVAAVLLRSLDEAVAPYRDLQLTLLAITLAAVVIFGIGSTVTARRIAGPIKLLSASAERLGAGDYVTPITVASLDEVNDLAKAFEAMRQAVQQREAQVRRLAYWDPLTGLPNRAQLTDALRTRLAATTDLRCAVLMLDLDRFKHINDVLGHAFGDRVLCQIGDRLAGGVLREGDLVARLSGDEFAILLPEADASTALAIANRVRQAVDLPLRIGEQTVDISAGVGVAICPAHGRDADVLLGRAEMAMYAAKARQCGVLAFEPSLDSASAESLSMLSELREAVEHGQLRLFLQPKIALNDGRVLGAEALVRWQHPTRGLVPPMSFIPFAEQTGFIRVLSGWMIERCAARAAAMRRLGHTLKFAVNLSTRDLMDQDLPGKIARILDLHAMAPDTLCLEITESAIMEDPERAMQTLARLKQMGLRLSIDDFGTGYSSLAYLKRLPLHELKIDKSFVMSMEDDRADLNIVRSTIDLAHNLGLTVVAEGVENAAALALLRQMGCDQAQGYFIAKPMPESEFADWLAKRLAPFDDAASATLTALATEPACLSVA